MILPVATGFGRIFQGVHVLQRDARRYMSDASFADHPGCRGSLFEKSGGRSHIDQHGL